MRWRFSSHNNLEKCMQCEKSLLLLRAPDGHFKILHVLFLTIWLSCGCYICLWNKNTLYLLRTLCSPNIWATYFEYIFYFFHKSNKKFCFVYQAIIIKVEMLLVMNLEKCMQCEKSLLLLRAPDGNFKILHVLYLTIWFSCGCYIC